MKLSLLVILFSFIVFGQSADAQVLYKPVKWSFELPKKYEMGDTIIITFTADIDEGWFMYSSDYDSTVVIPPAKFSFKTNGTLGALNGINAIGSQEYHDTVLNATVKVMKGKAVFVQRFIVYYSPAHLEGTAEYEIEKRSENSSTFMTLIETFDKRF